MRLPNVVYKFLHYLAGNKKSVILKYPTEIDGGLTNVCDLKCKMCLNGKITKKKGFMSFELFKSMVDTIRDKCESKTVLGLGLWGEPLLHPNVKDFLKYATENGVKTKIASNCVNLTKDVSQAIINSNIILFEISLYTLNKNSHNKMVGKNVYDTVLSNIHTFLTLAEENKFQGQIRLRPLENHSKEVHKYQKEFYDKYSNLNFVRQEPKKLGNWAGFLGVSKSTKKVYVRKPCTFSFTRLTIDWDGEVYMCCLAMLAKDLSVGYISKDFNLYDMWNSKKLDEIRNKLLKLDYSSFPSCKNCLNSERRLKFSDIFSKIIKK